MSIPSLQHFWPSAAQTLKSVHLPIPRTHIEEVPEDQYTSEHTPAAAQLEESAPSSAETKPAMPPDASAPVLPSHEQFIATLQNRTGFKFLSRNPNSLSMIESLGSSLPASEDLEEVRQRHEPSRHPAKHESAHEIHKEEKREHHELKKRKDHHSFLKFLLVTGVLGTGIIAFLAGRSRAAEMKRIERETGKVLDRELTWLQRLWPFYWPEYARKIKPAVASSEGAAARDSVTGASASTPAATFTDTSRPWQHPYYNSYYDYPPGYRDYPYRDPYWWRCPGERPPNRMVQWLARKYNDFFKVVCDCSYRGRY